MEEEQRGGRQAVGGVLLSSFAGSLCMCVRVCLSVSPCGGALQLVKALADAYLKRCMCVQVGRGECVRKGK